MKLLLTATLFAGCLAIPLAGAQDRLATAKASAADYAALAQWPDFPGVWDPDWSRLYGNRQPPAPKLTPSAAKALAAFEADKAKGRNLQTQAANCNPVGMPQIMRMPYPIEFIFSPGRVTIAIETYSQVRRIYMDGRPLPEDPDPAYNGSSVGHWEGQELVVDTIGLNTANSIIEGVKPTEATRIQERFKLQSPDLMLVTTTLTDPALFTEPYVMKTAYARHRDWEIREYVCQENNRDSADEFGRPSMSID